MKVLAWLSRMACLQAASSSPVQNGRSCNFFAGTNLIVDYIYFKYCYSWMNDLKVTVITSLVHATLLHHTNKIFTFLENAATIIMKSCKNNSKRGFRLDTPQHPVIIRAYSKTILTRNIQEGLPPLTGSIVYNLHDLSSTTWFS